jgi:hypothetical protein
MCDDKCMFDSPCSECASDECDYWVDDTQELRKFDIDQDEV